MKIWDYWKIFKFTQVPANSITKGKWAHNGIIVSDMDVIINKLHSDTYKLLRKFKAPQYNTAYVMRNKKGFNTLYCTIRYDIIVCDKNGKVLEIFDDTKPGFVSDNIANAYSIYFTTLGTIKHYEIKKDDLIEIRRLSDWY